MRLADEVLEGGAVGGIVVERGEDLVAYNAEAGVDLGRAAELVDLGHLPSLVDLVLEDLQHSRCVGDTLHPLQDDEVWDGGVAKQLRLGEEVDAHRRQRHRVGGGGRGRGRARDSMEDFTVKEAMGGGDQSWPLLRI